MYNIYKFQENQRTFLSSLHSQQVDFGWNSFWKSYGFHPLYSLHFTSQPACGLGLRQLGLSVCRRWRSLASRYGFWGRRLWHRTCKTSRGWLAHRTCKTSPGLLPGAGFGTERARLVQGGFLGQFYKRNPFKRNFWKSQILLKKLRGVNFPKEIPFKFFSQNLQNLRTFPCK